ncbi:MAG: hypothetical protein ACE366_22225 [Bradymonadia bacterium]
MNIFVSKLSIIGLFIGSGALFGCEEIGDALDPPACTPGEVQICPCPGGGMGTQVCAEDGESFDQCVCGGDTADRGDAFDDPVPDNFTPDVSPAPQPEPDPEPAIPDVEAELLGARIRVLVVGGSLSAEVEADWRAEGADDLLVDLQVKSQVTHLDWTTILADQAPVDFAFATLPVTQGERRFDFRVVAKDGDGNTWVSNSITIR